MCLSKISRVGARARKCVAYVLLSLLPMVTTSELEAGRGGAIAGGVLGGLAVGTIIGSAATSRSSYKSDRDYINALEDENDRLHDENADLRAEIRSMKRYNKKSGKNKRNYAR